MTWQRTALSVAVSMLCTLPQQQAVASSSYFINYQNKPMFELQILNAGETLQDPPDIFMDEEFESLSTAKRNITEQEINGLLQAGSLWAEILGPGTINTTPVKVQVVGLGEDYENASAISFPNLNAAGDFEKVLGPTGQFTMNEPAQFPANVVIGKGLNFSYPSNWYTLPDGGGFDFVATVAHEFGHLLGISFFEKCDFSFNSFLYDNRGVQYTKEKDLKLFDGNADNYGENDFLVGLGSQSGVYFKGRHVSEVLAGSGLEGIAINGAEWDGSEWYYELSHFELERSMMSHQNYRNYTFFMEAELAAMQDLGYTIDRKNFYGRSIYANGQTIVNTQGFYARNSEGSAYLDGKVNTATLGTGLHVYGKNNNITQAADLLAGGTGGVGMRVDGSNNVLTIADGVQVRADGLNGTGVLFAYGSNHKLNVGGLITALGKNGKALCFDFGGNLLGNETEYRGSYIWTYYGEDKLSGFNEATNNWWIAEYDDNGFEITNYGALMREVNITGTIAGTAAAVYISENALVQELNVLPGASIVGDIVSKWDPNNDDITDRAKNNEEVDLTTALNFGAAAGGTSYADRKFAMTLYGSIDGFDSFDMSLTDGELTVLGHTETASLYNNGELTILGKNEDGYVLETQKLTLSDNSLLRLPAYAFVDAYSAELAGTLAMLIPQDYYSNGDEKQISVTLKYDNSSGDFNITNLEALSPTLSIRDITAKSHSGTGETKYFMSGTVYRNADAYAQYADSSASASAGYALVHLADSADSPYADLLSALDFSSLSGSSIRKALHSVSAESYSAAAQASLRQLNAENRMMFYRQWAEPIDKINGIRIYGDLLYGSYDSDGASWDSDGFSAVVGADAKLSSEWTAGINLTLSSLNTDIGGDNDADADATSVLLGMRALYRPELAGFYLQGNLRAGIQNGKMDRTVSVNGYHTKMDSDWLSFIGTAQAAVGYDLLSAGEGYNFRTGPFAGVNYSLIRIPDIDESGSAAIDVDGTTYDSLPLELGWRFKLQQELKSGSTFELFADVSFFYDVMNNEDHTEAAFKYACAPSFDSELEHDGRSGAYLNLGAQLKLANGFSAGLSCGAETGSDLTGLNMSADFAYLF
ncbi:autotransporter domain-containing protein [Succinatimonas hippei]|uniref:autotransporter outer membrane beta-barrel domain-containing protein n=1 Tax=Succinatimonas hippei TaxID=626938 RepID=UPI0020122D06|nr:autotransporter outer membrane beta-barrel domain-containing protein [Succinatimonas hippei]MCL1604243.1 autotransporter domain-containing protein [Succinatimonas hippei]